VAIYTSVNVSEDPLTGRFTGAGYWLPAVTTQH
jgi:GH25 family lysozyme M1 (1,4-beta-N-acetylmuramidase)